MRPALVALLAALLGLAVAPLPTGPASASCAAPTVAVDGQDGVRRPVLVRGTEVTVTGSGFVDGCDDTGEGSVLGCGGDDDPEVFPPFEDVELRLGRTTVGAADAEGDVGRIAWTFMVPEDAEPGRAVLRTPVSAPLEVTIR